MHHFHLLHSYIATWQRYYKQRCYLSILLTFLWDVRAKLSRPRTEP
jgi:hypothetical protein